MQASRSRLILPPERRCGECPGVGRRVFFGKLERTIDPLVDDLPIRWSLPHAGPARRLQRKFRIELRRRTGELYSLLDRRTERLAVEPECVRTTDLYPKLGLLAGVGFEGDRSVQQCDSIFDLIASSRSFPLQARSTSSGRTASA